MSTCKPILFSAPMIRALLSGAKTQTRRIAKPPTKANFLPDDRWINDIDEPGTAYLDDESGRLRIVCPYGGVGDLLWVRECAELIAVCGYNVPGATMELKYRADGSRVKFDRDAKGSGYDNGGKLFARAVPSIHMPRWASRITLRITSVRVERLREISEADSWAEGLFRIGYDLRAPRSICICDEPRPRSGMAFAEHVGPPWYAYAGNPREAFRALWDGINNPRDYCAEDAPHGWSANPWVWVLTFERVDKEQS